VPAFTDGNPHCVLRASRNALMCISPTQIKWLKALAVVTGGLLSDPSQLCDGAASVISTMTSTTRSAPAFTLFCLSAFQLLRIFPTVPAFSMKKDHSICPTTPNFPSRFPKPSANAFPSPSQRRISAMDDTFWITQIHLAEPTGNYPRQVSGQIPLPFPLLATHSGPRARFDLCCLRDPAATR